MFDIVDTAFNYDGEWAASSFLQESSLHIICNAHTAFLLCLAEMVKYGKGKYSHAAERQRCNKDNYDIILFMMQEKY